MFIYIKDKNKGKNIKEFIKFLDSFDKNSNWYFDIGDPIEDLPHIMFEYSDKDRLCHEFSRYKQKDPRQVRIEELEKKNKELQKIIKEELGL